MLPSNIRINTRFIKEADKEDMDTCLLTSTYYSSKGLEGKIVILVDVDFFSGNLDNKKEIMDRKLLYVGMTRASEKLIIHGKNFYKNSFAKDIKISMKVLWNLDKIKRLAYKQVLFILNKAKFNQNEFYI